MRIQILRKKLNRRLLRPIEYLGTYVNFTTKKIDTKTIILLTDQAISFLISIKHIDKGTFKDSIELASFSNMN